MTAKLKLTIVKCWCIGVRRRKSSTRNDCREIAFCGGRAVDAASDIGRANGDAEWAAGIISGSLA